MTLRSTVRRTGSPISPPQNGSLVVETWWGDDLVYEVIDGYVDHVPVKQFINDALVQGHTAEWVL